jgi:hypothetical protein
MVNGLYSILWRELDDLLDLWDNVVSDRPADPLMVCAVNVCVGQWDQHEESHHAVA